MKKIAKQRQTSTGVQALLFKNIAKYDTHELSCG